MVTGVDEVQECNDEHCKDCCNTESCSTVTTLLTVSAIICIQKADIPLLSIPSRKTVNLMALWEQQGQDLRTWVAPLACITMLQ